MVKEKGNYLMPFFSSIKVSVYANYLAETSTGRGRTTIIFLRKIYLVLLVPGGGGGGGVRGQEGKVLLVLP